MKYILNNDLTMERLYDFLDIGRIRNRNETLFVLNMKSFSIELDYKTWTYFAEKYSNISSFSMKWLDTSLYLEDLQSEMHIK